MQSDSDLTPVELPPDVSLQRPLEETSLAKNVNMHQQPSLGGDSEKSAEALMPMEESHVAPSTIGSATSTVVTAFSTPQGMVTSMVSDSSIPQSDNYIHAQCIKYQGDTTFEEKHGGHVSHSYDKVDVVVIIDNLYVL